VISHSAARLSGVALRVPDSLEVPDYVEALVYRVAQEALRNARTHGRPSSVEVSVRSGSQSVVLVVVDDGRGFDLADLEDGTRPGHFG
jgi:two-component system NarL family sensor kinase